MKASDLPKAHFAEAAFMGEDGMVGITLSNEHGESLLSAWVMPEALDDLIEQLQDARLKLIEASVTA
jgi:hypothetical protein